MLQYYINIIANTQHFWIWKICYEPQQIEQKAYKLFFVKKLTQVEVGYGLLNVAEYVRCKVAL